MRTYFLRVFGLLQQCRTKLLCLRNKSFPYGEDPHQWSYLPESYSCQNSNHVGTLQSKVNHMPQLFFQLGFLGNYIMTSQAPRDRLICPSYVRPHVIRLLQDHWFHTVKFVLNWSFMSNFSLFNRVSIKIYENQIFNFDFFPIREYVFVLSFLTILNIYKNCFKGRQRLLVRVAKFCLCKL